MSNINIGRVVLGGLLAGLVLNIGEFLLHDVVLVDHLKDFMAQHNFQEPGSKFIAVAVGLTFVTGIVLVLGYAMIRSRLGPGVKTAIIAGIFAWFGVYFYKGIVDGVFFGWSLATTCTFVVWGLGQYALAAVAGAWLYKET